MRMNIILFVILVASPAYAQAVDTEVRLNCAFRRLPVR